MNMKRVFGIIISMMLICSLMTGCSNPVDTYKTSVNEVDIQAMVTDLNESVDALYEASATFDNSTMDMDSESEEAFISQLGLVAIKGASIDVVNNIEDIEVALNGLDLTVEDEEVIELHKQLTDSLDAYKEMTEVMNESVEASTAMMTSAYGMVSKGNELGNLIMGNYTKLSDTFLDAFMENQQMLEGAMMVLADDSFLEMLETGKVDQARIEETLASVEMVKTLINSYEAQNDSDTEVKTYLVELIDSVTVMLEDMVAYGPIVEKTKSYDGMQGYVDVFRKPNLEVLNEYIEGVQ